MTVHSLTDALLDTATLVKLSKQTGLTHVQVRAVFAALHGLETEQIKRIAAIAERDRVRQINREGRRGLVRCLCGDGSCVLCDDNGMVSG